MLLLVKLISPKFGGKAGIVYIPHAPKLRSHALSKYWIPSRFEIGVEDPEIVTALTIELFVVSIALPFIALGKLVVNQDTIPGSEMVTYCAFASEKISVKKSTVRIRSFFIGAFFVNLGITQILSK